MSSVLTLIVSVLSICIQFKYLCAASIKPSGILQCKRYTFPQIEYIDEPIEIKINASSTPPDILRLKYAFTYTGSNYAPSCCRDETLIQLSITLSLPNGSNITDALKGEFSWVQPPPAIYVFTLNVDRPANGYWNVTIMCQDGATDAPTAYPHGLTTTLVSKPSITTTMTFIPTIHPTLSPTIYPTINTEIAMENNPNHELAKKLEILFSRILIVTIFAFVLFATIGTVDAKFVRINDFYRIGTIIQAMIQILDMLSDCFLAIDVSLHGYDIMLYICIGCIVVPSLLSLFQLHYYSAKLWSKDDKIREWILTYSKVLYFISLCTGSSFTAVDIMNSNILGLGIFTMNLSNTQMISFKTQRIWSIVLLENVPQLGLQVWYMVKLGERRNIIAISSAIFSAISIIVTILSMTMEKSLINSQEYMQIKMDVTGKCVTAKKKQCQKRVKMIRSGLSSVIGLEPALIEILKPRISPMGLTLEILLHVNNEESRTCNYSQLIEDARMNGSLAQLLYNAWQLSAVPLVSNLNCTEIQSINTSKMHLQHVANSSNRMDIDASVDGKDNIDVASQEGRPDGHHRTETGDSQCIMPPKFKSVRITMSEEDILRNTLVDVLRQASDGVVAINVIHEGVE